MGIWRVDLLGDSMALTSEVELDDVLVTQTAVYWAALLALRRAATLVRMMVV